MKTKIVALVYILILFLVFCSSTKSLFADSLDAAQDKPFDALQDKVIIPPSDVSIANSLFPNDSFSGEQGIGVGFSNSYKLALFRFDLSPFSSLTIESASFSAYLDKATGEEMVPLELLIPTTAWCGGEVTWSTKPPLSKAATASAAASTSGWISWDVTELVQTWQKDKEKNYGFALGYDKASYNRQFAGTLSKNPPKLTLTYTNEGTLSSQLQTVIASYTQATMSGYINKLPCPAKSEALKNTVSTFPFLFEQISNHKPELAVLGGIILIIIVVFFFASSHLFTFYRKKKRKKKTSK